MGCRPWERWGSLMRELGSLNPSAPYTPQVTMFRPDMATAFHVCQAPTNDKRRALFHLRSAERTTQRMISTTSSTRKVTGIR